MSDRVLVTWGDEPSRSELARLLAVQGLTAVTLAPGAEWLGDLLRSSVDLVVVDPGANAERVETLLGRMPEPRPAVLPRPADSPRDALLGEIARTLAEQRLRAEIQALRALVARRAWCTALAGDSPAVRRLREAIEHHARSSDPLLLVGEPGSGRRSLARAIHLTGARAGGPLHEIDCEIQPPERALSQLFGSRATNGRQRSGWLERSHGGSLLLAGAARLPHLVQERVADFLADGVVRGAAERTAGAGQPSAPATTRPAPVGGGIVRADVRILGTLEREPEVEVAQGWLSPVLWREFHGGVVRVPPLRARRADLDVLVEAVLRDLGAEGIDLTSACRDWIEGRPWRGNLAELEAVLGAALLRRRDRNRLDVADLEPGVARMEDDEPPGSEPDASGRARPSVGQPSSGEWSGRETGRFALPHTGVDLTAVERDLIEQALARTGGNQTRAAELLGLSRQTLIYRMQKHGIR